jgi:hypothetical protein
MAITKKSFIIYSGILPAALYFNHQDGVVGNIFPQYFGKEKGFLPCGGKPMLSVLFLTLGLVAEI